MWSAEVGGIQAYARTTHLGDNESVAHYHAHHAGIGTVNRRLTSVIKRPPFKYFQTIKTPS
jgi:hypothetical protein